MESETGVRHQGLGISEPRSAHLFALTPNPCSLAYSVECSVHPGGPDVYWHCGRSWADFEA